MHQTDHQLDWRTVAIGARAFFGKSFDTGARTVAGTTTTMPSPSGGLLRSCYIVFAVALLFFVSDVFSECVFEFRPVFRPGSTTDVLDYNTYFNNSPTTDCGVPRVDISACVQFAFELRLTVPTLTRLLIHRSRCIPGGM